MRSPISWRRFQGLESPENKQQAIQRTFQEMLEQAMEALEYIVSIMPANADILLDGQGGDDTMPIISQDKPVMMPLGELFKGRSALWGEAGHAA